MPIRYFTHPAATPAFIACAAVLQALPATLAHAQTTLPEVQVTAPNTPAALAQERLESSRQTLSERAGGTATIDAQDFANGKTGNFADMLAYASGVYAQTRHGDETRLSIRGSGIQRGFLLRGLQLYQDGMPLSHADGQGDFQSVDPLATEFIEVWRGANALELGANSLGGAINYVSPTGLTAPPVKLQVQTGAFGFHQAHAALATKGQSADGYLSATRSLQTGYRQQSATRATRLQGNVGWILTPTLQARLYLAHIDSQLQMPGSLSAQAMQEDPRQAAPRYQVLNAHNDYRLNRLALKLSWQPSENLVWESSLYTNDRKREHAMVYGFVLQNLRDTGFDSRATWRFDDANQQVRKLIVGTGYQRMSGDENRFANQQAHMGAATGANALKAAKTTAYAEYTHGLSAQWQLQAGLQYVRTSRMLTNHFSPSASYDKWFSHTSPKLGAIYQMNAQSQFFGNISRSYEAPPFGEMVVRPTLPLAHAQKAHTVELGYRLQHAQATLDASVYRSRIQGELLSLNDASGAALGTVNANRTVHQGLELGAAWSLKQWRLRANYLYQDFHFQNDPLYGRNRLAGIAPHVLNAELRWQPTAAFWLAPAVETRAGKTWIDHANTVSTGGFTLLNLTIGGDLQHGLSWFMQAKNLTNRRYVAGTAVQANARGKDGSWYFPGDARAFYAGLTWAFE